MNIKSLILLLLLASFSFAITSDIKGFDVKRNGASLPAGACVKGGETLLASNTGLEIKDIPIGAVVSSKGCVADLPGTGVCFSCGGVKLTSTDGWLKTTKYTYQSCSGTKCYLTRTDEFVVPEGESYYGEEFTVGMYAGAACAQWLGATATAYCANKDTKTRSFLIGECSSDSDCSTGFCGSDCMCHSLEEEGWTHPNHNSYGDSNIRRSSSWGSGGGITADAFSSTSVNKLWEVQLSGSPEGVTRWVTPISFVEPESNKNLIAVYEGYSRTDTIKTGQCSPPSGFVRGYTLSKSETFKAIHKIAVIDGTTGDILREIEFVPYTDKRSVSGLYITYEKCMEEYNKPLSPSTEFNAQKDDPALKYMAFIPASESQALSLFYSYNDFSTSFDPPTQMAYVEEPWKADSGLHIISKIDQSACGDETIPLDKFHYISSIVPIEHGAVGAYFVVYKDIGKVKGARVWLFGPDTLNIFSAKNGCQMNSYDPGNVILNELPLSGRLSNVNFEAAPGTVEMGAFSLTKAGGENTTYTAVWASDKASAAASWKEETLLMSMPYLSAGSSDEDFVYDIAGYARDKFYVRRVHVKSTAGIPLAAAELLGSYSTGDYDSHSSMAKFILKDYPNHYFMAVVKQDGSKLMVIEVPESGVKSLCEPYKICKWEYALPFTVTGLVASADLDGDGNDELIAAGEDHKIHFMKWVYVTGLEYLGESKDLGSEIVGIAVDDVDKDGYLDVLAALDNHKLVALSWLPPCKVSFTVNNMVCAEDGQTASYSINVTFSRSGMTGDAVVYPSWKKKGGDRFTVQPGEQGHSHKYLSSSGDLDLSGYTSKVIWNSVEVTPVYNENKLSDSSCSDQDLLYVLGRTISPDLPAGVTRTGEVSFTVEQKGNITNSPKKGTEIPADVIFIADNVNEYKHCKISESYDGLGPGSEIALDMNDDDIYESWKFESDVSDTIKYENVWGASCVNLGETGWRACEPNSYAYRNALLEEWIVVQKPGKSLNYSLGGSCGTSMDKKLLQPGTHSGVFKARYDEDGKTFNPQAWFMFRDLNDTKEDGSSVVRAGPMCLAQTSFSTIEAPKCVLEITPPGYACYDQPVEFEVYYEDDTGSPGEVTVDFGGDNTKTVTVNSGDTIKVSNQYSANGTYTIRADAFGKESGARCSSETQFTVNEKKENVEPFVQPQVTCNTNIQELVLTCTDQKGEPVPSDTVENWEVTVNGEDKSSECSAGTSTCTIPLSGFKAQDFVYTATCHVSGTNCYVYTKTTASTSGDFNCSFAQQAEGEGVIAYDISCTQQGNPLDCTVTRSGEIKNGRQSIESVNCKGLKKDQPVTCTVQAYNDYPDDKTVNLEFSSVDFTVSPGSSQVQINSQGTVEQDFAFTPGEYGKTGTINGMITEQGFPEDYFTLKMAVEPEPGKCSEDCRYCYTEQACQSNSNCAWNPDEQKCEYKQIGGLPEYPEIALFGLAGLFAFIMFRRSK